MAIALRAPSANLRHSDIDLFDLNGHCSVTAQVKGDSTMAVRLAQKKDRNIIKDLKKTLKQHTMKLQQLRAEYMQSKDEVLPCSPSTCW